MQHVNTFVKFHSFYKGLSMPFGYQVLLNLCGMRKQYIEFVICVTLVIFRYTYIVCIYFSEFTRFIIIFSMLFSLSEHSQYSACSDVEMPEAWCF